MRPEVIEMCVTMQLETVLIYKTSASIPFFQKHTTEIVHATLLHVLLEGAALPLTLPFLYIPSLQKCRKSHIRI
ncbi:hypothetical protein J6590_099297 [Homalodisca vitripennis]|nr:hypothetical protein J6590_099297 [Homalodisca vitripennis]